MLHSFIPDSPMSKCYDHLVLARKRIYDEILEDDLDFYEENESDTHDNSYLMYAFQDDVHFGW